MAAFTVRRRREKMRSSFDFGENRKHYQHRTKLWQRIVRCLIHIPIGGLTALLFSQGVHLGWCFFLGFFAYEIVEDARISDHAYVDILGWLVGFPCYVICEKLFFG